ncbi:MAG: hypothetical protein QXT68_03670 [Halobacteria archaeon]
MTPAPDNGLIRSQAAVFRLLGHPKRLKLAHLCAQALREGRDSFASKHELVRAHNRLFREEASLNDLNYDIERLVRGGLLERREKRSPNPARRSVRLGIRRGSVEALPLDCKPPPEGSRASDQGAKADPGPVGPGPVDAPAPVAVGGV